MGIPTLNESAALRLHEAAFVFDGHNDLAPFLIEGESLDDRAGKGHLDLRRMRTGGLNGGIFAVWIDPKLPDPLDRALSSLRSLVAILDDHPDFLVVRTADDLQEPSRAGRIVAVPGIEGGYPIASGRIDDVDRLFDAGMRCLTLSWMRPTEWVDAAGAEPLHGGLTEFGVQVLDRLARLGALIDVSHCSDRATEDVLTRARSLGVPVAASHSGARSIADHPRNLPDDLLEAIAATDGIVGINFFSAYIDEEFGRGFRQLQARFAPEYSWNLDALGDACSRELIPVPFDRILEHVEHVQRVAGVAHVGLGSDFDGVVALPAGLRDVADLPRISAGLAARGFDEPALRAFLGANWLRTLEAVLP